MSTDTDERREQVLEAVVLAGVDGVSGQAIADRLGCSRAAVHRHIETLRRNGVGIDGVHEGYRLAADADPIVPRIVQSALTPPIAGPVIWTPQTGSTNDDAVAQARAGAAEGLVIGTDFQQAGRGRRGREWHADPGDAVLCSVLVRPPVAPAEVGVLPVIAAVAVADALSQSAGIVWPNDIVIDGKKVCGVLCEMSADESGVAWVVVGLGINVRGVPSLADTRWQPGALRDSDTAVSRSDVLIAVLTALSHRYAQWLADGPAAALRTFAERDLLHGAGITVDAGGRTTSGTACGVDEQGRLRVMTEAGEIVAGAGEVTRVERG
jgi:BirA family transcriptional regulator, biotin operon repressor / biotin---[acetyl-CoA-carboxylase] ligase